jgi:outer membrane protein assembly factor BamB
MNVLTLGINGYVVAINKNDGNEIWRTKLKSSSITVVTSDADKIYATTAGHLYCLDKLTGQQLWVNSLKGLGYGTAIIDLGNQASAASGAAEAAKVAATTAATAAVVASSSAAASSGSN